MDKVFFYKICNRCDNILKYLHDYNLPFSNILNRCKYCKPIPDENLQSFKEGNYSIICKRCGRPSNYVRATFSQKIRSGYNNNSCIYCHLIPDNRLELFKQYGYSRKCPKCDDLIEYKTRSAFYSALRRNTQCKRCVSIETNNNSQQKLKSIWIPIIDYWPKYKTFVMIRNHWNLLSDEEKSKFLEKTPQQKYWYWGHLRRKNRVEGHRKCRQIMAEKYGGENHWMKRPEVLAKIKKSCEKYRGDGHWFRR